METKRGINNSFVCFSKFLSCKRNIWRKINWNVARIETEERISIIIYNKKTSNLNYTSFSRQNKYKIISNIFATVRSEQKLIKARPVCRVRDNRRGGEGVERREGTTEGWSGIRDKLLRFSVKSTGRNRLGGPLYGLGESAECKGGQRTNRPCMIFPRVLSIIRWTLGIRLPTA